MTKKFMFSRSYVEKIRKINAGIMIFMVIVVAGYIACIYTGKVNQLMNYILIATFFLLFPLFKYSKYYLWCSTVRISLDDNEICELVPGKSKLGIKYAKVGNIDKYENGLSVSGDGKEIFVDSRIDGYLELEEQLRGAVKAAGSTEKGEE